MDGQVIGGTTLTVSPKLREVLKHERLEDADPGIKFQLERSLRRILTQVTVGQHHLGEPRSSIVEGTFNLKLWRRPYGVNAYMEKLETLTERANPKTLFARLPRGFTLKTPIAAENLTILDAVDGALNMFAQLDQQANSGLLADRDSASLNLTFSFPLEVKRACEQYLLHFADFLRDLGVESTLDLREVGQSVLFSIAPADRRHALSLIRRALDVYLTLPGADISPIALEFRDQMVRDRLSLAVRTLRTQLEMAEAHAQLLGGAVQAQSLAMTALAQLKGPTSVASTAKTTTVDQEPIFGGLITLSKAEKAGVQVNLAELLRRARAWFHKK